MFLLLSLLYLKWFINSQLHCIRYKDGFDYIGEHKDDEKDLMKGCPIASLSLGQPRDFIFRHQDSRGKNACRKIEPVNIELEHGSLLLMNHPTNQFWYHSLPQRKKLKNVRINLTFRKINCDHCKPVWHGCLAECWCGRHHVTWDLEGERKVLSMQQ